MATVIGIADDTSGFGVVGKGIVGINGVAFGPLAAISGVNGLNFVEFPQIFGFSQPSRSSNCKLGSDSSGGLGLVWERIFMIPSASA